MPDIGFGLFVAFGGFVVGLIVGFARKHGLVWTIADSVFAGIMCIAAVYAWFGLWEVWPAGREYLNDLGKSSEPINQLLQALTLFMPVFGILIGLWVVSMLRRRFAQPTA